MTTFIIRRILISIPVFLGITFIVFVFIALAPGDASTAFVRPEFANDPAALARVRERLGLDQPLPIRYVRWLGAALTGELGYRIDTGVLKPRVVNERRLEGVGGIPDVGNQAGVTVDTHERRLQPAK